MTSNLKKDYLFLGFAIPNKEMEKIFEKDQFPQVQTHKFIWNLIKGLEYCDAHRFTYISARPINEYPCYQDIKILKRDWEVKLENKKIRIIEIPFYNKGIAKILTRFLSSMYYGIKEYSRCKNKGGIIVYSVHVPFMLTGYILSRIYRVNLITIWTDPPTVIRADESIIKRKSRIIELNLSKFLMKKANKVISLTKYLATDYAPGKPYIVVEGIIDEKDVNFNVKANNNSDNNVVKVVYSGSIEKKYGIKNIVEGFLKLSGYNVTLDIYGRGDFETDLKEICKHNELIRYHGFIPNSEILRIQREADFLINARSCEEEYVKYSFPSKTLEYMVSGTPLITTMLPGIPEEYREHIIALKDNFPETIANTIKYAMSIDKVKLHEIANNAQLFALNKKYQIQGKRIVDFINS